MNKRLLWVGMLLFPRLLPAQSIDAVIDQADVDRVERTLSSDNMQGRAVNTSGIEKAAGFIASEFKAAGLQFLDSSRNYRQEFSMVKVKPLSVKASFDGMALETKDIVVFSSKPDLIIHAGDGYEKMQIKQGDNFLAAALKYIRGKQNLLVLVDPSFSKYFSRLANFSVNQFKGERSVVFVLTTVDPSAYEIEVKQQVEETRLANMVGVLPGKTKQNEYVIFSAHYDHLGIGSPDAHQDSIFNGANDDASGSTAVIMLAKYFAKIKNNERTLVFVTFTAEEIGEYGSAYFSNQFDPGQVVAMFNIEMIGTESKWGTNSAYITGYEKTNMGDMLQKNLAGSPFKFYPDPYPQQGLFYRSDNASLARQGVPAHTISTSKMDSEKYYHTQGDEIGTLDLKNMTEIIKAIAISSGSIVEGKEKPSRVDSSQLK
jgi:Peptidase family M28